MDRIIIDVEGSWQHRTGSGFALFQTRLWVPTIDWFNSPQPKAYTVEMQSHAAPRSTLGALNLTVFNARQHSGNLKFRLEANPTRTLAHLFARLPASENFIDWMTSLRPEEFFASAEDGQVPLSLDRNDNWIAEPRQVRELLGSAVFGVFLPVYIEQLQLMLALLLQHDEDVRFEGTDVVLETDASRIAVQWGRVNVPQIEWYFERYHYRAGSAVRHGAFALLSADHNVQVRHYADRATLERENDSFRIAMPISTTRRLVIYAKSAERIRFEVRRDGRGYYRNIPVPQGPADRLRSIMDLERREADRSITWPVFGELLSGPDEVTFSDLAHLIYSVLAVFPPATPMGAKALMYLIEEGGFSSDQVRNRRGINKLLKDGIIEQVKPRRRDMSGRSVRYALRAPYRELHHLLTGALPPRRG